MALTTKTLLAAACWLAVPGRAYGDAREASVVVHASSGAATVDDPEAPDETRTTALTGLAVRFSYATHDAFAYEAELSVARTAPVLFDGAALDASTGQMERASYLARVQAGCRLRLGAAYIPTLSLGVGAQAHAATQAHILLDGGLVMEGPDGALRWAPIASAGLGFEHRLGAQWVAGVSMTAVTALTGRTHRSIEGGVHVSYFWYPKW
ncbi:hypothetical protein [Haliangium ochraceum]|uniref:Outer membrane protein beta-barrel domain-containing protein n=1 Tax=Haliangium ochraceum (strain DSM 14365 / JCM 11303 / SMP-2) TaxID=502025 RepID=D0LPQ6_HALO1|nr:hypothetical protein [Haliangium ochraceum]ACY15419.1 hypothetical protein Hoch_2899 [Haliangium ochraceum DSM 14365]